MSEPRTRWGVTIGLLVALVAVFVISFIVADKTGSEDGEAFGGTDGAVTEILEENGAEPWFEPLIDLGSGELESGLFALQAGLGAGILGYAFGNLRGRSAARKESDGNAGDSGDTAADVNRSDAHTTPPVTA